MNVLDFEKIIYNFDRVRHFFDTGKVFPIHAIISLTNKCNHHCIWCTAYEFQNKKIKELDKTLFIHRMREAHASGLKAITYVGNGEPTAYERFEAVINEINSIGLEQGMFTNGFLLDRHMSAIIHNFLWVRISLDAGSPEVFEQTHRVKGQFDRIINNISELARIRKGKYPTIGVQYGIHQINLDDMYQSANIVRDAGADYFSIKAIFNRGAVGKISEKNSLSLNEVEDVVERVKGLEDDNFKVFFRPYQMALIETKKLEQSFTQCVAGHFSISIWEDGQVSICGPFKVMVGNIYEKSLEEISLSDETVQTIRKLDLSRCADGCRYLKLNHLVETLQDAEQALHVNFI